MRNICGLTFHGGHPSWKFAAGRLREQSRDFDQFTEFQIYNPQRLSRDFKVHHERFIKENPRGFGHWIWKPQILFQQYLSNPKADFYYYQDAGGELFHTNRSKNIFEEYLAIARENGVFVFESEHKVINYTKASFLLKYEAYNLSPMSKQCMAGSIIISNHIFQDFITEWIDLMSYYENLTDPVNPGNEGPCFVSHRHDQSCLDLLIKKSGIPTNLDTSSWTLDEMIERHSPIWNVRNNSRSSVINRKNSSLNERIQNRLYGHFPSVFWSNSLSV